jgi:hypothetical protein
MRDLGQLDAKLQSCKDARPGMKVSGKEDSAVMGLVTGWWSEELADDRCWVTVQVQGEQKLLVRYENRPAGDSHAVCAALSHQGSGCAWPCIWCEVRHVGGIARLCKEWNRYACHHSAFTGIHPSILPHHTIPADELGKQPEHYATTMESSREALQPRRKEQLACGKGS